ncbi:MAG: class II glutamine amidotransferase [Actinomycetota bacterium]
MCELLGISIKPAAKMGVYFKAFQPRAEANQSGWGVGWYQHGRATVIKEAQRADESKRAHELIDEAPTSEVFVIHVREATVGTVSEENTHPFVGQVKGRDWLFAHNGTINGLDRLDVNGFTAKGDTDSEVAFHFLLTRLEQLDAVPHEKDLAAAILSAARLLSGDGKVNFLLTDGVRLYAYHDGHKSLHFLERHPHQPDGVRLADDPDYIVDLIGPEAADESAVIVATLPLNDELWTKLEPGEFLVCKGGKVVERARPESSRLEYDRK